MLPPRPSLVPSPHHDQSTLAALEEADGGELPDVRLSTEERELVKRVIAHLEQRLGVDGLMFAAAACEDAAVRLRTKESRRA